MPRPTRKFAEIEDAHDNLFKDMNSGVQYRKTWDDFLRFNRLSGANEPREEHVVSFLVHLREKRDRKGSSLWCTFSKINKMCKLTYNLNLTSYSRITALLKQWASQESPQQSAIFSLKQLEDFLLKDTDGPKWVLVKAYAAVCFVGGLRCKEVVGLKTGSVRKGDDGWYITYEHCKAITPEDRVGQFFIQEASSFGMALSLYMKQRGSLKTDRLFVQSTH